MATTPSNGNCGMIKLSENGICITSPKKIGLLIAAIVSITIGILICITIILLFADVEIPEVFIFIMECSLYVLPALLIIILGIYIILYLRKN